MKYFKLIFFILPVFVIFFACNQESDICTEGGTPRMKIKFKKSGKLFTVDSLTMSVLASDSDTINVLTNAKKVDSVLVPMKINGDGFTDILVKVNPNSNINYSKIHVEYDEKLEYVSPGCGMRKLYDNISANLKKSDSITSIEINSNQIHNENTTVIYLVF